jgi:arginase
MPLRFLMESQDNPLGRQYATIPADSVVLVGTRDLDPPEAEYIRTHSMAMIGMDAPDIIGAIARSIPDGARDAYVHIDLDVLDPRGYRNVKCPVKDGISIETLVRAVSTIAARMRLVGLSIVENTETDQAAIALLDALFDIGIRL